MNNTMKNDKYKLSGIVIEKHFRLKQKTQK